MNNTIIKIKKKLSQIIKTMTKPTDSTDEKQTCQGCIYLEYLNDGSVTCSIGYDDALENFNRLNIRPCKDVK